MEADDRERSLKVVIDTWCTQIKKIIKNRLSDDVAKDQLWKKLTKHAEKIKR